ncbi:(E)-4-hydroxy-3-methylbut-2-enyl-diphosphate synthase [Desulfobaculum xiamenense]|uniref:4-hydroxy-3-methylbut-2-en-1-yl diphosphate synthase (flavodoxin) n=1 Tax=Desulfobaculum xiamenense TaxID=995050 RepID=A0A846QKD5_9BACT|nr:flavodoxin-dependent (E)-4-hydroxy-3-methylbut-2-enyl-diphosphate synthase [Desulfobaculum xiamenense]NJB69386.1 (E)-4-hydroxy-3-methylbut-2-enyl-diphosphate synthase [Desulfobaculum xiamenense]
MEQAVLPARRRSRVIRVGNVAIGGDNPVVVQSMANTDTRDVAATLAQIESLAAAGCEIVRLAVLDDDAVRALAEIRKRVSVPLVADIHFDHRLALGAVDAGVDGLRINPGNIGDEHAVDAVVRAASAACVPIRIGVNSGSVEKGLLRRFGGPTPEAMVESALGHVRLLEERDFHDIKISIKSSSVLNTVAAYRLLATRCDYPLHIGVTEAGTLIRGTVKSSVGLGLLLAEGIGDTMRVSLTGDPVDEMGVAWEILRSLGLRARGPEIVSCPTCGRTEIDLVGLAQEVERHLRHVTEVFTVAVMGCVVNGPGEAREADIGIAGGRGLGIIFRKGEVIRKVRGNENLVPVFLEELDRFLSERRSEEN